MNDAPSYYAWQPSLESNGSVLVTLLTSGRYRRAPEGDRAFFEQVLSALHIDAALVAWGVEPFLTSYFSSEDNGWVECWAARLLLAQKLTQANVRAVGAAPIFATPVTFSEPRERLLVRVIADFTSNASAVKCRDALRGYAAQAKWNEIHYEGYRVRNIAPRHKQLFVDVATLERSDLERAIVAAHKAMEICEEWGGSTRVSMRPAGPQGGRVPPHDHGGE